MPRLLIVPELIRLRQIAILRLMLKVAVLEQVLGYLLMRIKIETEF